ncbi:D-arabinitol 2-dehydrogenase [Fusarium agapanthi]|uniref:D-arabinitol 2-dehydrogenase n=1 Tax=Fusarium agapanthi TaxID=1803897 RepID=A0A9P5BD22_9HYPO|nr:D-arabinitol 2-dehydrogenase [Fusarium agapanthi]
MANLYPFQDKVIVVSGASRGTGLALSRYLLVRGAKVSMAATSEENLKKAVAGIEQDIPDVKERVIYFPTDVRNPDDVKAWIEGTVAKWGELDGAANVAAKMNKSIHPIEDLELEELKEVLDVNVIGTFNSIKYEMKNMKPGGSIVNCGSQQVKYASGNMGAYAASKNAIRGLSQSAAYEGGAKNPKNPIRVNLLCPGCIDTDMIRQPLHLPNGAGTWTMTEGDHLTSIIKRYSKPEEIAASIAFLSGDESRFMTKQEIYVDGGWMEVNYVLDMKLQHIPQEKTARLGEVSSDESKLQKLVLTLSVIGNSTSWQICNIQVLEQDIYFQAQDTMTSTGKSPLKLILGAANVGDKEADPWARYDTPDEVKGFINVFAKRGYTQLDTAAVYSPQAPYSSEARLGAVNAGERFSIDTKADFMKGHTKENITLDIDNSLKHLKINQINVYYLRGISNFRAGEVQEVIDICEKRGFVKPAVYQSYYNALVRAGEKELFPVLRKNGMAFYAYSPAAGGLFSGSHKNPAPNGRFDPAHKSGSITNSLYIKPSVLGAVDKAIEVFTKHNIGGHAAALRWTAHYSILDKKYGDGLIIGASSPQQLESNVDTVEEGPLPEEVVAALNAVYEEAGDEVSYHM